MTSAPSSSIHSRAEQVQASSGQWATRRARRCSADGVGLDTLALERFRASLVHRDRGFTVGRTCEPASDQTIDERTIDASASAVLQRTINAPADGNDQPQQSNTLNPDRSSSGSSTGTLSTLSSWTSGSEGTQGKPARELGRSISVPSGGRALERNNFLDNLCASLLPASGDVLRARYMMAEPGKQSEQPAPGQSETVIRRSVPGRRNLVSMSSVVEEVVLTKVGNAQGRPPTGKRSFSAMQDASAKAPDASPNAGPSAHGKEEDADDLPPTSSELANTVEPPYQSRRTLKYYTRRYRTSINYNS
ncbi:uncharacterized protein LOC118504298 [Anopheles stephensi]|uniref:uncharacterized protein LOC118504298 n=1 Tax=Anopheles stephensi TaxID=30069 RepID=UPI0016588F0F|nr:uncharacterized protein LOC118504298 [Anopheles stephensi]